MEIKKRIGVLTYKLGIHNRYYYLASDGQWLLSSNQEIVDRVFNPETKTIIKKKIGLRSPPRWKEVFHFLKSNEGSTVAEISRSLNFFVPQVAPLLTKLATTGRIKKHPPRRCTISNHSSSAWITQ
tara:strand:+ start:244 stop:621 length:378 start_codon:yes stop_codon:yes gene_type:complete